MMTDTYKRRKFIQQAFLYIALPGIITVAGGCGDGAPKEAKREQPEAAPANVDPCKLETLTEQELKQRDALGYTAETPIPEQTCENCKLYIPENDTKPCGTCTLFKGPVALGGYCTYWADRAV